MTEEIKLPKSWQELKDALDEARLIIQVAETRNKQAIKEDGGAWIVNCPFQQRIDAFLEKWGRFPTEEK